MRLKTLLIVGVTFLFAGSMFAQEDVMIIEGGNDNAGLLEATINGDTLAGGVRANPNRIYELKKDEFYIQRGPIKVTNPGGVVTIRGQKGGAKPVILKVPLNEVSIGTNNINSSLVFQNIQYHCMETSGTNPWICFQITGDNHRLLVEDCFVENARVAFETSGVKKGASITYRNNYFRDLFDLTTWWHARAFGSKASVDTLILENNTFASSALLILFQNNLCDYAVVNHNTFVNGIKYPFLNSYWKDG